VLAERTAGFADVAAQLRAAGQQQELTRPVEKLVFSYAHMFLNRLLDLGQDDKERACYEFLRRFHESTLARGRQRAPTT